MGNQLSNYRGKGETSIVTKKIPRKYYYDDDVLLLFGGNLSFSANALMEYDARNDRWIERLNMFDRKRDFCVVRVDDNVMVVGGYNDNQSRLLCDVEMIHMNVGQREFLPSLAYPRYLAAGVKIDNHVYIMGGWSTDGPINTVVRWDLRARKWENMASMNYCRYGFGAVVVHGEIYVMGGRDEKLDVLKTTEKYDPTRNRWVRCSDMPVGRFRFGIAVHKGEVLIFGGWHNFKRLHTSERYNTIINRWIAAYKLPYGCEGIAAASYNNEIVIIGGEGSEEQYYCDAFVRRKSAWSPLAPLPIHRSGAHIMVVPRNLLQEHCDEKVCYTI